MLRDCVFIYILTVCFIVTGIDLAKKKKHQDVFRLDIVLSKYKFVAAIKHSHVK